MFVLDEQGHRFEHRGHRALPLGHRRESRVGGGRLLIKPCAQHDGSCLFHPHTPEERHRPTAAGQVPRPRYPLTLVEKRLDACAILGLDPVQ